jgi:glycosyltransferase involved in cell wall biosynthesis
LGEFLATQLPDDCVADAACIRDYYLKEYGFESRLIAYGAPTEDVETVGALEELHLARKQYLLYVSRLEPENNAHRVIAAYRESKLSIPLVLVGDAPYSERYIEKLRGMAEGLNVVLPGAIYGGPYRELLSHCFCFIQATEVGGTHPALIEAMGAGCIVLANDTPENREVVSDCGLLYPFNDEKELGRLMRRVHLEPEGYRALGEKAQERVRVHYNWEKVADSYEELFYDVLGAPTA